MKKSKLYYFAARGDCEQIRLILAEGGVSYEEITIRPDEMYSIQSSMPVGELPLWEEDNLKISHANAIMRHLARKMNLYGSTEQEKAICDMWDEECQKILLDFWTSEFMKYDFESPLKAKKRDEYCEEVLIPRFKRISAMLARNDNLYLNGHIFSYVDVKLFCVLEAINREIPLLLLSFPLLESFYNSVERRPNIQKYLLSRSY